MSRKTYLSTDISISLYVQLKKKIYSDCNIETMNLKNPQILNPEKSQLRRAIKGGESSETFSLSEASRLAGSP